MKVTTRITSKGARLKLARLGKPLQQVPQQAYTFFRSETPIRTGNARSRTSLVGNIIQADYPYAARLDRGYSRQAPDGMSRPTIEFIKKLVRTIFGR